MKKKLLSLLLLIVMFFGIVPTSIFNAVYEEPKTVEAVNHSGGYIYFDNSITQWSSSYKFMLLIGHNSYSSVYEMEKIDGTNLYYYSMPAWGGATYCAVVANPSLWNPGNFGPSNRTNAKNYTNVYNNYGFNSGSTYLIKPASAGNNCSISINYYSNGYKFYNDQVTINANINTTTNATGSTSSTVGGTVNILSYYLSGNGTSASSNANGTSTTYKAVKTANATLTATASTGYKFLGWYDGDNLLTQSLTYTIDNLTNSTYTYTAKFSIYITTVTFNKNANDATGSVSSVSVPYNTTTTLPSTGFTRSGYFFAGWNTKADGTGTTYNAGNKYSYTNKTTSDQTLPLYAIWKIQVTITLLPDGGTVSPTSIISYETLTYSYHTKLPTPSKTGYTFLGWYDGATKVTDTTVIDSGKGNHSLTAKWQINSYTITYNGLEGATNVPTKTEYTVNDETFEILAPFREYYTFLGWSGTGINGYTDTITINKGSTGEKVYTANWEQKVTIYFDMTGVLKKHKDHAVYWPFIYYFHKDSAGKTTGSVDWDDKTDAGKHRFIDTGKDNIWVYEIDFTNLSFNTINNFIIAFYEDSDNTYGTHDSAKQTIDINYEISYKDNGKAFRIVYDDMPYYNGSGKIDNFSFQEATINYMIDDTLFTQEEIKYHNPSYQGHPVFKEQEGFKLEGWHTSTDFSSSNLFGNGYTFDKTKDNRDFKVYANYVEAHDYYIYVDAKDMNWDTKYFSVYKWNEYYDINNSWPGVTEDITYLGNGMYRVFIDASKSFDKLIFCNIKDYIDESSPVTQTEDIIMSPLNSYYIISTDTTTNNMGKTVQKIIYEQTLTNFLNAQKNLSYEDGSAFRFACGLQNYTDLVKSGKEFGFKFIFIKDNQSYVGYWNFDPNNKLDCIRYVDELYEAGVEINGNTYTGFYALTLTDSITFNYSDYDQIIVVGCYRDKDGTTQVIKAVEFNILSSGDDIYLYELER